MKPSTLRLVLMLLIGIVIGLVLAPQPADAQAPRLLYVSSSGGGVPAAGSTAGVLSVTVQ
jgi:hypothetical protein